MLFCLTIPRPFPIGQVVQYINTDVDILHHLEIKHAYADEIRTVLEGIAESILRFDGSSSQDLEANDGHLGLVHELDRAVGEGIEQVVVPHVVIRLFTCLIGLRHLKSDPILTGMRRPIAIMVHGLHVVVRDDALLLALDQCVNGMGGNTCGDPLAPDNINQFTHDIDAMVQTHTVADRAMHLNQIHT